MGVGGGISVRGPQSARERQKPRPELVGHGLASSAVELLPNTAHARPACHDMEEHVSATKAEFDASLPEGMRPEF